MNQAKTYDGAPMSGALPPFLELSQAAHRELSLTGRLMVASMPRLASALVSSRGEANVTLHVARDLSGRTVTSGHIEAEIEMTCQRCLNGVRIAVRAEPRLAWVKSDSEAEALPPEYEPLVSTDGHIAIVDLVADELLLALPLVPKHGDGTACEMKMVASALEAPSTVEERRKNPFAELAKLKRGR